MDKVLWVPIGLGILGVLVIVTILLVVWKHKHMFRMQVIDEQRRDDRRESLERSTRYRELVLMKADEATMSEATSDVDSMRDLSLSGLFDVDASRLSTNVPSTEIP